MSGGVPVVITREAARQAARRELSKPAYHRNDPSLLQRALDWLFGKVTDLLDAASRTAPGHAVGIAAVIVLAVAIAVALRLRLGRLRTTARAAPGLFGHRARTAAEHRAAAERHAGLGEWRQAVQERMRALVRELEERTILDPRPGRTADEAAAEAGRALPAHAARLREAAASFDGIAYGGRPASPEAYAALSDLETELRRAQPAFTDITAPPAEGARI